MASGRMITKYEKDTFSTGLKHLYHGVDTMVGSVYLGLHHTVTNGTIYLTNLHCTRHTNFTAQWIRSVIGSVIITTRTQSIAIYGLTK